LETEREIARSPRFFGPVRAVRCGSVRIACPAQISFTHPSRAGIDAMTTANGTCALLANWLLRFAAAAGFTGVLVVLCGSDLAFSTWIFADENGPVTVNEELPFDTEAPEGSVNLSCADLDADFNPDAKPNYTEGETVKESGEDPQSHADDDNQLFPFPVVPPPPTTQSGAPLPGE
jgi:hypothetical protein